MFNKLLLYIAYKFYLNKYKRNLIIIFYKKFYNYQ